MRDNPRVREIGRSVHSWFSADTFLQNSNKKKLAHNTTVERFDDGIGVRYHSTVIVFYHNDRHTITVNTGGWNTVTTRQRINALLPKGWGIVSEKQMLWLAYNGEAIVRLNNYNQSLTFDSAREVMGKPTSGYDASQNPPRRRYPDIGVVSEGTLVPEELRDTFASELREWNVKRLREIEREYGTEGAEDEWDDEYVHEAVDALMEALGEVGAPYTYFGASEGDGALFGWWIDETAIEMDSQRGGDIAIQSDRRNGRNDTLTKQHRYLLKESDHGNWTLIRVVNGREGEVVWSVV